MSIPSEVALSELRRRKSSTIESSSALAWASLAGAAETELATNGRALVAARPASASRRLSEIIVTRESPLSCGQRMFGFDFQAVALDVDDPPALADGGGLASRGPLAVADPHPAAMRVDRLHDDHDLAKQPRRAVVEQRVGAVVIARRIETPAADSRRQEGEDSERRELQRQRQPEDETEDSGRNSGGADENQRKARRDQFGDQQHDAADQPQPAGLDAVHFLLAGAVRSPLTPGAATVLLEPSPNASLATSPIPPSVTTNWVASTGHRNVLELGEVANLPSASTY